MFRRAFYNTGAQLAGRLISAVCMFVATLILARNLGGHYFGEYIKLTAAITLFYPLADFGLNTVYLKEAKSKETALFGSFLILRLLLSLVAVVLFIVVIYVGSLVTNTWLAAPLTLAIGASALVAYSLTLSVHALFQVEFSYRKIAGAFAFGSLFFLCATVVFAPLLSSRTYLSPMAAILVFALGAWVTAITSIVLFKGNVFEFAYSPVFWRHLMKASLPLGIVLLLNFIYFRLDTFILAAYRSSAEVGAYGFAYKFFDFALVVPTFFMTSLYPALVKQRSEKQLRLDFQKIRNMLFIMALGVGSLMWLGAPFLRLVSDDYQESVVIVRLLILSLPIFYVTSPYMWWYVIHRKQKLLIPVYGLALVVMLIANLVLIPRFGARGASITTGIAEVVVLFLSIRLASYDR